MKLLMLDIPESTPELAAWLAAQLVSPRLGELVAELRAVHARSQARLDLPQLFGGQWPAILQRGLGEATRPQLQTLLQNPALLLDLQERILIEGGAYWQDQLPSDSEAAADLPSFSQLQLRLAPIPVSTLRSKWLLRTVLAVAACVLVAVVSVQFFRPAPPQVATGWGWNRSDAFPEQLNDKAYLQHLADGAQEWFKKRPETRADLALRITQFRNGCDAMLAAEHKPLKPADKAWLLERCRVWRGKFEQQLTALERGDEVAQVRGEADATVEKLVQTLRGRLT